MTRQNLWSWRKYVALTLTTTACSLQDYAYLGQSDESTDTRDADATGSGSETDTSNASGGTTVTSEPEIDAALLDARGADNAGGDVIEDAADVDAHPTGSTDATREPDNTTSDDAGPRAPLVVTGNLIPNSSFENPPQGWSAFGESTIAISEDRAHTGVLSLLSAARVADWEGPALNVKALVEPGQSYQFRAWVLSGSGLSNIKASMKIVCAVAPDGGAREQFRQLVPLSSVSDSAWFELSGATTVPDCTPASVEIYLEGPPPGIDFYVDDVSLVPG